MVNILHRYVLWELCKVFFPATAANSPPGRRIVTPTAAETDRNSRREIGPHDLRDWVHVVFMVVPFIVNGFRCERPHPVGTSAAGQVGSVLLSIRYHCLPGLLITASMTRSRLKLPGFWRGGNSRKLCSHCPT